MKIMSRSVDVDQISIYKWDGMEYISVSVSDIPEIVVPTSIKEILVTRKLLNQGLLLFKLKSSLRKVYGCHYDLVNCQGTSVSQMTTDMFHLL
jgi:hypothetical protein